MGRGNDTQLQVGAKYYFYNVALKGSLNVHFILLYMKGCICHFSVEDTPLHIQEDVIIPEHLGDI